MFANICKLEFYFTSSIEIKTEMLNQIVVKEISNLWYIEKIMNTINIKIT